MDSQTVEKVARAAHIRLTEEELERYTGDLDEILTFLGKLDDAPGCENWGLGPIEVADIKRNDEPHIDIDPEVLLKDMDTYEGFVRGPRLL